jgi:DNA-binding MarR family transcriptional regulator
MTFSSMDAPASADVHWLDEDQQHTWRAYLVGTTLLMERLDRDLREQHDLSMPEYEILVRLSEAPDRRMRMAVLAESVSHSRSRVTHTIARLEKDGLVSRAACVSDGRGVEAALTERGMNVLEEAAPTHVAGVRRFLVDLAGEHDFEAVGRVFDAVTDRLIEENPAADIR